MAVPDVLCRCGRKMYRMDNPYVLLKNLWVCRSCGLSDVLDTGLPSSWWDVNTADFRNIEDKEERMRVRGAYYSKYTGR